MDKALDSRETAREIYARGYFPLVIRKDSKSPAVRGHSGHSRPSREAMFRYIETIAPDAPIALSLPIGVVGIDVDTYLSGEDEKWGGRSLCELEDELGELPATWMSTRRGPQYRDGDTRTGIYLYQLPAWVVQRDGEELVKLASSPAPGIETIQYHERIVVCAPTVLDDMPYRWWPPLERLGDDRTPVSAILPPPVSELPVLPDAWVLRLYRSGLAHSDGRPALGSRLGDLLAEWHDNEAAWTGHVRKMRKTDVPASSGGAEPGASLSSVSAYRAMDVEQALAWAAATIPGWNDEPNDFVRAKVAGLSADFGVHGSRHDSTRDAVWHVLRLCAGDERAGKPGNAGGDWAIRTVCGWLVDARDSDTFAVSQRMQDPQVREETARLVVHALAKLRADAEAGRVTIAQDIYGNAPSSDWNGDLPDWTGGDYSSDVSENAQIDVSAAWDDFDYSAGLDDSTDIDLSEIDTTEEEFDEMWDISIQSENLTSIEDDAFGTLWNESE